MTGRVRIRPVAALALGLLAACESDPVQTPPACGACHDLEALAAPGSTDPPREHAAVAGEGLVEQVTLIPTSVVAFGFTFPRRGGHGDAAVAGADCAACHPVSEEGIRHGLRQYPRGVRDRVFAGGQDCAAGCHAWLPAEATSAGFTPAVGEAPTVSGSFQPFALLTGVDSGHARVFREGYVRSAGNVSIKRAQLRPGCGGCHNQTNEAHGTVSQCLDCHRFGGSAGEVHGRHVQAIEAGRAVTDPEHLSQPSCDYCHGFSLEPTGLKNAACYACHLSGHQPLGANGAPHFW